MATGTADLDPCHLWQNISMSINVIFCLWNSDVVEKVKENILPLEQKKNGMCSVGQFMCPREIRKIFQSICMDCLCHLIAGFRMKDADTTEAMKRNTRPVLFFHGEKDTYVYPNNSFQNYMLCKAPKELVIVQGARHLCSAYADPELYQRTVMEFFEKYDGSNSEK